MSPVDEERYRAECAIAVELQTIDAEQVPREGIRDHLQQTGPRLALTDDG